MSEAVIAAYFGALWLLSLALEDASIVDIAWGPAFILVAWLSHGPLVPKILTTIWGVRLGAYLGVRNLGHGEDRRYRAMRRTIGRHFWIVSLFTVFVLQGLLVYVISLPLQYARSGFIVPGVVLWGVGFFFESVGDFQLARFKASNEGGVMDRGLWRYTRHPNYFGDFCVWWGLYLSSHVWWTVISPIVMSVLLLRVSGVALLEKTITSRRPEYASYVRRTSPFFPMPPKS